ncbi:MAG: hypothetical protein AAFQ68_20885 [Bacteroidota bacterium]
MKQLLTILCFLPISLLAQSAMPEMNKMDRVEQSLVQQQFSNQQLDAFRLRAEQKLIDFCEASQALSNQEYPAEMKAQIVSLVESYFVPTLASVMSQSLVGYLGEVQADLDKAIALDTSSIQWLSKLVRDSGQGRLAFRDERGKQYEATISLQYQTKSFGTETETVWTVLLVSIEQQ